MRMFRRQSKRRMTHFGMIPQRGTCGLGHAHDSREEAAYCNTLTLLQRAGEIKSFDVHKTFRLDINGVHILNHRPDFVVTNNDGSIEVREYKGLKTEKWEIQKRLWAVCDETKNIPYKVVGRKDIL